jgi:hypothetical protein
MPRGWHQRFEQRFKTFVEHHHPATIAFVCHGTLTVIEVATPEQAKKVATARASISLSTDSVETLAAIIIQLLGWLPMSAS